MRLRDARSAEADRQWLAELLRAGDATEWQHALTADGHAALDAVMRRGPQVVVTSHDRPVEEYQAVVMVLRHAGMPLVPMVNPGGEPLAASFARSTRSPVHLHRAVHEVRRGKSVFFAVPRKPLVARGGDPGTTAADRLVDAVGPVLVSRHGRVPLSIVTAVVTGRRRPRLRLDQHAWHDTGASRPAAAAAVAAAAFEQARRSDRRRARGRH